MGPFSFNGGVTGLPLADFLLGRVFEFREATPFRQNIKQPYFALYAQDTWRVSPNITLNYGARWEPWFPQDSVDKAVYTFDVDRMWNNVRSTVYPEAPAGLYYPGDPGFPGNSGMDGRGTQVLVAMSESEFTGLYGLGVQFIDGGLYVKHVSGNYRFARK